MGNFGLNFNKPIKTRQKVLGLAPNQPIHKILTVDDKEINCQLLIKLLDPLRFEVKEASNGIEAIAIWEEWEPHLIFMDMRMPVMDGYSSSTRDRINCRNSRSRDLFNRISNQGSASIVGKWVSGVGCQVSGNENRVSGIGCREIKPETRNLLLPETRNPTPETCYYLKPET